MVSKQLCLRPEVDNHWALRDFSSRLIAQICKNYHTTTNNCQTRVTRLFCRALANDKMPLASFYGALVGKFVFEFLTFNRIEMNSSLVLFSQDYLNWEQKSSKLLSYQKYEQLVNASNSIWMELDKPTQIG